MSILAKLEKGKLIFKDSNKREKLMRLSEKGITVEITPLTPESRQQRKFYHGAVLPLWAYLDGKDYDDQETLENLHEIAKLEFNPGFEVVAGKQKKFGKSTKGKLNKGFIEKIVEFLEEQYGIDRTQVLNPEDYKYFVDVIFSSGNFECYIDYLVAHRLLPNRNLTIT